jgi:hypothetical protein
MTITREALTYAPAPAGAFLIFPTIKRCWFEKQSRFIKGKTDTQPPAFIRTATMLRITKVLAP